MLGNVNTGGENGLYPISTLELRWSFIRKIYSISIFQLLLTIAVISVVLFVPPVANFFNSTHGTGVYIVLIFVPLIASGLPEFYYYKKHPHDYFFLLFLNVSSALPVGLTWVFAGGKMSLEIVILITIMILILTLYTFEAAKRGHDLSLLYSFLFGSFSILIFLSAIQILFPLGTPLEKLLSHIFECIVSIIFCGCVVYDSNYLMKKFTYDQHIKAFIFLYVDVIITFFIPLLILRYI